MAMDRLADRCGVSLTTSKWNALIAKTVIRGEQVLLMKPQTYMNLSGRSVAQLSNYFHVPPQKIIVLFDDISLPPGRLRIRSDGSAGGHNGIKSIIAELGSQDFPRVKIGVGAKPNDQQDLADWVLSNFSAKEEKDLSFALQNAADASRCIVEKGIYEAANRFNGSRPE
jgi:PTH1 family peptidyl-tRNA hydrolase